jgi:phenylacetate-CoA ligase
MKAVADRPVLADLARYLFAKVPRFRGLQGGEFDDLPVVTKREMMADVAEFVSDDYSSLRSRISDLVHDRLPDVQVSNFQVQLTPDVIVEQTTGTTGIPGRFPKTRTERGQLALPIWSIRKQVFRDVSPAGFLPFVHGPIGTGRDPRVHSRDFADVRNVFRDAAARRARWLHVQPTLIKKQIGILRQGGIDRLPGIFAAIETTGERLSPEDRAIIADFFDCMVINQYGSVETWAIGYDCTGSGVFSLLSDNVYLEIFRPGTRERITQPGEIGEVAVTSLRLRLFPVVRYLTGDRAEWVDSETGQALRLHEDRTSNLVLLDGKLCSGSGVMRILLNHALARFGYLYFNHIQFVQTSEYDIDVLIEDSPKSRPFFAEIAAAALRTNISKAPLHFHLKTLSPAEIEALPAAKRSLFVNRLPPLVSPRGDS